MPNSAECLDLGIPTAHAQNRLDMPFNIVLLSIYAINNYPKFFIKPIAKTNLKIVKLCQTAMNNYARPGLIFQNNNIQLNTKGPVTSDYVSGRFNSYTTVNIRLNQLNARQSSRISQSKILLYITRNNSVFYKFCVF